MGEGRGPAAVPCPDAVGSSGMQLLRPLLAVLGALILLFAVFELAERNWWSEVDADRLRLLHRLRAGLAALITAGFALRALVLEGRPLLAAGPFEAGGGGGALRDVKRKRDHYARWLIVMRWIAIAVATVAVVGAVEVLRLLPQVVGPSLLALIALLTVLNIGYALHLRYQSASAAFLALQVYVDIAVLILLLHLSGGIENPLTPLLLLHVIIAGIVLGRRHAHAVAVVTGLLFALLGWAEYAGVLPHYTLRLFPHHHVNGLLMHAAHDALYVSSRVGLQAVLLLLVAHFTTTLVERIRHDERELEAQADHALAQTQTLERALETTGTALCVCGRDLRPYWANGRWTNWVGTVPELRRAAGAPASVASATLEDGAVRMTEVRSKQVTDGERVFHLTVAPLRDREGEVNQVVMLARDVTEQHRAQARALRAERLAAAGELAGRIAHEVNNPIAIISAKVRLLLRDNASPLPRRATSELIKITELSDRVARIAQGLLSSCRPTPGARAPLDIRAPARRALAYVESRAMEQGVDISDELRDARAAVAANAAELEQVFLNLFLNALDAMPSGGRLTVRGKESASSATPSIVLEVCDTGPGVPAGMRQKVFEPFLTTRGGRGTGLGLSICQGVVRSHGGSIRIEDAEGGGARVVVTLPTVAAQLPVHDIPSLQSVGTAEGEADHE